VAKCGAPPRGRGRRRPSEIASCYRSGVSQTLEAALELTRSLAAGKFSQVDQDVIILIGIGLLVHPPALAVVRVVPMELTSERAVGIAKRPDVHCSAGQHMRSGRPPGTLSG